MKLGFTGTRRGMTDDQYNALRDILIGLDPEEVHHGDCVGADCEFDCLCRSMPQSPDMHIHPGTIVHMRALCTLPGDTEYEPKPPLARNDDIVNAVDVLIACPATKEEQQRGGTWYTVRAARKRGIQIIIVYPDGSTSSPVVTRRQEVSDEGI